MNELALQLGAYLHDRAPLPARPVRRLVEAAVEHRVEGLVAEALRRDATAHAEALSALAPHVRARAALDLRQTVDFEAIAGVLHGIGVRAVALKGAALATTVYEDSALRPRTDIDLLLPGWEEVEAATTALHDQLGYRPVHQLPGRLAVHARPLWRPGRTSVDLHVRVSRSHVASRALPPRQVFADAWAPATRPDGILVPAAWHSMALSIIHAVAHHGDQRWPAIWLEDQSRLAAQMADDDWASMLRRAEESQLRGTFAHGLRLLGLWDPAAVPALARRMAADWPATIERLGFREDLRALPWPERLVLLGELALPPAQYLREHYAVGAEVPGWGLQAARWCEAGWATLSKRSSTDAA